MQNRSSSRWWLSIVALLASVSVAVAWWRIPAATAARARATEESDAPRAAFSPAHEPPPLEHQRVDETQSARSEWDPLRATVRLRGRLAQAHGLGAELDLRLARPFERAETVAEVLEDIDAAPAAPALDFDTQLAELERDAGVEVRIAASPDGHVDADVTALFENTAHVPRRLELRVRHPNFVERVYELDVSADGVAIDADALAREGVLAIPFQRTLEPLCVVSGFAWTRDGNGGPVQVEAWVMRNGRPLGLSARAEVVTAHEQFALSLEHEHTYAIVALAGGAVPMTRVISTRRELQIACPPFALDTGVAFDGRVALEQHLFGGDATLFLSPFDEDARGAHGPSGLRWNGSGFSPELVKASCNADGSFDVSGLVAGRYALRIGIDRQRWTEMDPVYEVRAPANGIVLTPAMVSMTWRIEHDGRAFANRSFAVRGIAHSDKLAQLSTDSLGFANAWMLSGEPYIVEVPMGRNDWTYGKIVPWNRAAAHEVIAMGARY